MHLEGDACIATKGGERLTVKVQVRSTTQHSFYLATEQLKHEIRSRYVAGRFSRGEAQQR